MIPLELTSILKHLKSNNIEGEIQKETNQICIILKIAEREFPVFIRIYEGQELMQILAFFPCSIKPSAFGDTARLLHVLNKEIDIPGFGMDEASSAVFYRCMIPAKDKQISETIFDAFLNAAQVVTKSFAAVVAAVAYGGVSFDEVLKKSQEHRGQSVAEPQIKKSDKE